MRDDWETSCPEREDKKHCNHWYDGEPCCACGDNDPTSKEDDMSVQNTVVLSRKVLIDLLVREGSIPRGVNVVVEVEKGDERFNVNDVDAIIVTWSE